MYLTRELKNHFMEVSIYWIWIWTPQLRARPKAERVLLRIRENPEYERPAGRPAGRGHAFERLISLEPKARLTSGLLWWIPPSLLPCMGSMPNHTSTHCGTWRVAPVGCPKFAACCFSVTAGPIALKFCMRLGSHQLMR